MENSIKKFILDMTPAIDPDSATGVHGHLRNLLYLRIHGEDLETLYSDVCGERIDNLLAILRYVQMGMKKPSYIKRLIKNKERMDEQAIMAAVRKALPNFNRQTEGI